MRPTLRHLRRLWTDRSGASALEFGLLLPLFVPLVLGIMQVGQMFWTQTALQHAVEMAARCATINATSCGSAATTQTYATTQSYGLELPAATFTVTAPACGNQVAASYAYPYLSPWFSGTITLTATSCYPL